MPTSYFVDFTGYIDERKRPENFPRKVHIRDVYDNVDSTLHLQAIVNDRFMALVKSSGLVVLKDEDEPLDLGKVTFDKRMFVPWHMITYMTLDVKHVPNPAETQDPLLPVTSEPPQKPKDLVN